MRVIVAIAGVLMVLVLYRAWFGDVGYFHIAHLTQGLEEQSLVTAELEQRNDLLRAEVRALRSGLEAVESRARSDLGMIKANETFYLVVENDFLETSRDN